MDAQELNTLPADTDPEAQTEAHALPLPAGLEEADVGEALSHILGLLDAEGRQAGQDVSVYLFRLARGNQEFLTKMPPESFDLSDVKATYGGGKYLARIKVGNVFRRGLSFHVAGRPLEPSEPGPSPSPAPPGPDAPTAALARLAAEMRAMVDELRRPPAPAYSQNPAELALSIVGAMQSAVKPYQDAMLSQKGGGSTFRDMMDVFLQGLEMGREQAAPPPESFAGVAREILTPLMPALRGAMNPPPMVPGALPAPGPAALPPPDSAAPVRPGWAVWLAPYVPTLVRWAQARKDPEARAEIILDEIPQEVLPNFLALIQQGPSFVDLLAIHFPELAPYRPWLAAVVGAMRDSFEWELYDDDAGEAAEAPEAPPPERP